MGISSEAEKLGLQQVQTVEGKGAKKTSTLRERGKSSKHVLNKENNFSINSSIGLLYKFSCRFWSWRVEISGEGLVVAGAVPGVLVRQEPRVKFARKRTGSTREVELSRVRIRDLPLSAYTRLRSKYNLHAARLRQLRVLSPVLPGYCTGISTPPFSFYHYQKAKELCS